VKHVKLESAATANKFRAAAERKPCCVRAAERMKAAMHAVEGFVHIAFSDSQDVIGAQKDFATRLVASRELWSVDLVRCHCARNDRTLMYAVAVIEAFARITIGWSTVRSASFVVVVLVYMSSDVNCVKRHALKTAHVGTIGPRSA